MKPDQALLIVDVQNDFCSQGALPVPEGETVVPVLNQYLDFFVKKQWLVIASRDWHPERSKHFQEFGGKWPRHCVQSSVGAQFYSDLQLPKSAIIVSKGMNPEEDSYSAFQGLSDGRWIPLGSLLQKYGIKTLFVGGLATDYCVKASVLDALECGLRVNVLIDAVKGVNLQPNDSTLAIEEMVRNGAQLFTLKDLATFR